MSSPATQAAALAAMLAAATGSEPRTTETGVGIRVEADLPPEVTSATRMTILAALAGAPAYGHERRLDGAEIVWAVIPRE